MRFIGKAAEGFEGDEAAFQRDGDRGGGKGTLGDGITEKGEGGRKEFVLMLERRKKSWRNVAQS